MAACMLFQPLTLYYSSIYFPNLIITAANVEKYIYAAFGLGTGSTVITDGTVIVRYRCHYVLHNNVFMWRPAPD